MSDALPDTQSAMPFVSELSETERSALQQRTAAAFDLDAHFRDALAIGGEGPAMAVIPAGVYDMGSHHEEFGHRREEAPAHYQQIAEPFAIGVHPVTAEEFAVFERDTGWRWRPDLITSEGRHPVINIRHGEAEAYCAWLSERTGQRYRLPAEAEWEYACRAGTDTPFAFGDSVSCRDVHFKAAFPYEEARDNKRWYLPKCAPIAKTVPVGSYRPNAWGLHDMHGNVWEMTASNWSNSYANLPRRHPAPVARRNKWIVVRGGSWFDAAVYARSAARRPRLRDELDVNLGFRVVRELDV
jgi:formylglycine-generating enzyme required for sulfatase activity